MLVAKFFWITFHSHAHKDCVDKLHVLLHYSTMILFHNYAVHSQKKNVTQFITTNIALVAILL